MKISTKNPVIENLLRQGYTETDGGVNAASVDEFEHYTLTNDGVEYRLWMPDSDEDGTVHGVSIFYNGDELTTRGINSSGSELWVD